MDIIHDTGPAVENAQVVSCFASGSVYAGLVALFLLLKVLAEGYCSHTLSPGAPYHLDRNVASQRVGLHYALCAVCFVA